MCYAFLCVLIDRVIMLSNTVNSLYLNIQSIRSNWDSFLCTFKDDININESETSIYKIENFKSRLQEKTEEAVVLPSSQKNIAHMKYEKITVLCSLKIYV